MTPVYVSYLLMILLAVLFGLFVAYFATELRKGRRDKRVQEQKRAHERQLAVDRETTFRERHGPRS